jgi:hypothetical protein
MACYMDGREYDSDAAAGISGYPPFYVENQMVTPPPVLTMVFLDESPVSLNNGFYFLGVTGNNWADLPAT